MIISDLMHDGIFWFLVFVVAAYVVYHVVQSICDDIWMSHYYNECDRRLEREFRD